MKNNVGVLVITLILLIGAAACSSDFGDMPPKTENYENSEVVMSDEIETTISEAVKSIEESSEKTDLPYVPTEADLRSADEMTVEAVYWGSPENFPASTELPQ